MGTSVWESPSPGGTVKSYFSGLKQQNERKFKVFTPKKYRFSEKMFLRVHFQRAIGTSDDVFWFGMFCALDQVNLKDMEGCKCRACVCVRSEAALRAAVYYKPNTFSVYYSLANCSCCREMNCDGKCNGCLIISGTKKTPKHIMNVLLPNVRTSGYSF